MRNALRARYALLPYLYTLFEQAERTGAPVMRPVFYEFGGGDVSTNMAEEEAFMLGPALFVRGVYEKGVDTVTASLPGLGVSWYVALR